MCSTGCNDALDGQLVQWIRETPSLMAALRAVRELGLPSWAIGAGAVRNVVWDRLHGHGHATLLHDVDVVYFDSDNASSEAEQSVQRHLNKALPAIHWDVTNQAPVHLWYEQAFGQAVAPLTSLEQGIATWPEYATCVGVCMSADEQLQVIAPYGLDDLFEMRVRWNPARVSAAYYRERIRQKALCKRWPLVRVELP